jgi:xyloglucan-specific exo-beta-1,4-glucanase
MKHTLFLLLGICSFFQTILAVNTFGNLAIGGGGFVTGIIPSTTEKGLMYARTDVGGAYRRDSLSDKWIPLLDWVSTSQTGYMGVESIALDPNNADNVYMLVGTSYFNSGTTAILRSTDRGNTFAITNVTAQFTAHGNGLGRQTGEKLVVDPNLGTILYCGTRTKGLFKSTNSGLAWTRLAGLNVTTTTNGNGISFVVMDPSSGVKGSATSTLFVGVTRSGSSLYRSNDGGATFDTIANAPALYAPQRAVLAGRNLIVTFGNGVGPYGDATNGWMDTGQIWKYNLDSGVWTNITPSSCTRAYSGISVDPANASRMIASTVNTYWAQGKAWGDQIFITTNGGSSWTNVITRGYSLLANGVTWMSTSQSIHWAACIEFNPFNTKQAFVVSGNGIFSTDNIDATTCSWKFDVKGLEETVALNLVSIPGGPVLSVIGDYDGFRSVKPDAYAPIHSPTMGTTSGLSYAGSSLGKVVRVGSSMYFSNDTAKTWTKATTLKGAQGSASISADGRVFLHTPADSSKVFRTYNNGTTWTAVTGIDFSTVTVADPVNPAIFYAYNRSTGYTYASADTGKTFAKVGATTTWGSTLERSVPGYEGHLWIPLYTNGLVRSINGGKAFTKLVSVLEASAVGIGKAAPGKTYPTLYIWGKVGLITGIFRSIDEGLNWTRINDDDHEWGGTGNGNFVVGDMNVFGRVYMSTVGRGIVYIDSDDGSVALNPAPTSLNSKVSIYLNDAQNMLYTQGDVTSIDVFSLNGNRLLHSENTQIALNTLPSGCYLSRLKTVLGQEVRLFVKN